MAAAAALLAAFLAARALLHAPSNAAADPHATLAPDAGLCLSPGVSAILELELELPAPRDAASHRPCEPLLDAHDLTICCSSIQSLPEALEGATCAGGVAPIGESFAPLARASDEVERRRHGAAQQSELAHLTRHLMAVARDALGAVQLSDTGAGVAASSSILSRRLTWLSDAYHDLHAIVSELRTSGTAAVDDDVCHMRSLLVLSSVLERFVADRFAHQLHREPPRILSSLLAEPELTERCLGHSLVAVLWASVGSPRGLNLRNVAWHGFLEGLVAPFVALLLALLLSLTADAEQQLQLPVPRQLLSLEQPALEHYCYSPSSPWCDSADWLPPPELWLEHDGAEVERLLERSFFFLPSRRKYVRHAWSCFRKRDYHASLALLLPQLEHGLRRVYVAVNNLPANVMCAASTAYYTTLDMFMAATVQATEKELPAEALVDEQPPALPNNARAPAVAAPNLLVHELGAPTMELLHDLFLHTRGPRLRDRVAHLEADPASIPHHVVARTFALVLSLCARYDLRHGSASTRAQEHEQVPLQEEQEQQRLQRELIERVDCAIRQQYTSCFHPLSILHQSIVAFTHDWAARRRQLHELLAHPPPLECARQRADDRSPAPHYDDDEYLSCFERRRAADATVTKARDQLDDVLAGVLDRTPSFGLPPIVVRVPNAVAAVRDGHADSQLELDLPFAPNREALHARLETLFSPPWRLSLGVLLSQVCDTCSNALAALVDRKLEALVLVARQGTASKRQLSALDKLVDLIDLLMLSILVLVAIAHDCLAASGALLGGGGGERLPPPKLTTAGLVKHARFVLQKAQAMAREIANQAWREAVDAASDAAAMHRSRVVYTTASSNNNKR